MDSSDTTGVERGEFSLDWFTGGHVIYSDCKVVEMCLGLRKGLTDGISALVQGF